MEPAPEQEEGQSPRPAAARSPTPQLAHNDDEHDDDAALELDVQAVAALLESKQPPHRIRVLEQLQTAENAVQSAGRDEARARPDEDAFFLVDVSFPLRKYQAWRRLFPRVRPFYAVKCCPNPVLIAALASALPGHACGFDCASIAELELALSNHAPPHRIILANPCKTPAALAFALRHGVRTMTFDSAHELHKIARELLALRDRPIDQTSQASSSPSLPDPELVLRLRVPDAHSDVPLGEKYGAQPEACSALLDTAMALGLTVVGVSFHCGSGSHSADDFCAAVRLARQAFDLAASKGLRLRLLDIGGGYPGWDGLTESPSEQEGATLTCRDIAEAVNPLLDELFPPSLNGGLTIIAEPGRFFVEGSHVLFAQVCDRRWVDADGVPTSADSSTKRVAYVIGEGVMGCMKDVLLCGESFTPRPLRVVSSDDQSAVLYESLVVGPSGEAFDVVAQGARLPLLEVGDWVYFTRVGAYTASIAAATSVVHDEGARPAYVATKIGID